MKYNRDGHEYAGRLPREALPDCKSCPKPDLTAENGEVVHVYSMVNRQQMYVGMGANMMGLRMEALVSLLGWLGDRHQITDPDLIMRRIWVLDEIAVRHFNAKLAAESEKAGSSSNGGQ